MKTDSLYVVFMPKNISRLADVFMALAVCDIAFEYTFFDTKKGNDNPYIVAYTSIYELREILESETGLMRDDLDILKYTRYI